MQTFQLLNTNKIYLDSSFMNNSIDKIIEQKWENHSNCGSCTLTSILEFFQDKNAKTFNSALEMYDDIETQNYTCGAIMGVNLAISRVLQNYDLTEDQIKEKLKEFRAFFASEYGAVTCHEILKEHLKEDKLVIDLESQNKCHELVHNSIYKALEVLNKDTNPLIPMMNRYGAM